MQYKLNPFEVEKNTSLIDFQYFIQGLIKRREEEYQQEKSQNSGDKVMKCLKTINDILNFMFYKDHK